MTKHKNILITGGAGFIGYHLTRDLLENYGQDISITLADNFQRGRKDVLFETLLKDSRIKLIELDLTNLTEYKKLGTGYDHVYHLAAVNGTKTFYDMPHEVLRINTLSTIYMLEWMRKENPQGKFCFTSSNEAYAGVLNVFGTLPIPTPEHVPLMVQDTYNPRWSYAGSKIIGEQLVIYYAQKYNFRALIVRPHNFYGPRAGYGGHVIPDFSERIAAKIDPFPILGAIDTRAFCYITDAVRAMRLLMDSKKTDSHPIETVHIGDTQEISIKDLAELMFGIAGWHPKAFDIKNSPSGSVKRRLPDISKLQYLTDWKPEMSLEAGLKKTHQWYIENPRPKS